MLHLLHPVVSLVVFGLTVIIYAFYWIEAETEQQSGLR